jgi:hypothetical protein
MELRTSPASFTVTEVSLSMKTASRLIGVSFPRLHLGHHILSHPHLLFRQPSSRDDGSPLPLPREIIELGAGTGFLSILLAQLGSDVISTDLGEPDDSQGDEQTPFKRLMVNARLSELVASSFTIRVAYELPTKAKAESVQLRIPREDDFAWRRWIGQMRCGTKWTDLGPGGD